MWQQCKYGNIRGLRALLLLAFFWSKTNGLAAGRGGAQGANKPPPQRLTQMCPTYEHLKPRFPIFRVTAKVGKGQGFSSGICVLLIRNECKTIFRERFKFVHLSCTLFLKH